MKPTLPQIVSQFQVEGELVEIKPYGLGHINSTFLVQLSQGGWQGTRVDFTVY